MSAAAMKNKWGCMGDVADRKSDDTRKLLRSAAALSTLREDTLYTLFDCSGTSF